MPEAVVALGGGLPSVRTGAASAGMRINHCLNGITIDTILAP